MDLIDDCVIVTHVMNQALRSKATGFESCLIKSWSEWELIDETTFIFHDCVLDDKVGLGDEPKFSVVFLLDEMIAEVGDYQDTVKMFALSFELTEVQNPVLH